MDSAMTSSVSFFPRLTHMANMWMANKANTPIGECSPCSREHREQMFANVRVRLKMFAYGIVPREAINEPMPFHPDEVRAKIK
jgi:hypothetical protein